MERYIEVIGEGQYLETASRFIAEVTVEVRAGRDETALREVAELCAEALASLRASGITNSEIVEGGTDFRRPWHWKKQVGQNAARKIILKVSDFGRLNLALEKLEPLQSQNKERKSISVQMRQPEFDNPSDAKSTALAQAYQDAMAKASSLATTMNCKLGKPVYIEEGGWARRSSGFSGDEDWSGDYSRFLVGGNLAEGDATAKAEPELQRPMRNIFIKCRVRFGIE